MATLYDYNNSVITERVTSVIPGYDTLKSVNRLLDGSWHVQTVGTGARQVIVRLICSLAAKNIIDAAESTGAPVKVTADGKHYKGPIREAPNWNKQSVNIYETEIVILANEEGDA